MGSYLRVMPLLSTLAALVIIVNSSEDDLDRDYRYDLRQRSYDTDTTRYDTPWKVYEAEPVARLSTPMDTWNDSPEDPVKRRRPVRKRKRPLASSEEDKHLDAVSSEMHLRLYTDVPEEKQQREEPARYHKSDEPVRYRDTEYIEQTSEMPRRRRKKPENRHNRWTDEYVETGRPLRRRGQRRKRPSTIDTHLSEFDDQKDNIEHRHDDQNNNKQEDSLPDNYEADNNNGRRETFYVEMPRYYSERPDNSDIPREYIPDELETPINPEPEPTVTEPLESIFNSPLPSGYQLKNDKSLSEFSMEMDRERKNKNLDNRPINPVTLKEILRRSNGTSLSEILQQQNLSLSDLLYGKEEAISLIKSKGLMDNEQSEVIHEKSSEEPKEEKTVNKNTGARHAQKEMEIVIENLTENNTKIIEETTTKVNDLEPESTGRETTPRNEELKENTQTTPKITNKRRFPNVRRKLRMRPVINNNYKGQLNRDLMALTARRYQNSRNATKSKEWKYVIPLMNNASEHASEENSHKEVNQKEVAEPPTTTTTMTPEETTTFQNSEYHNPSTIMIETQTEVTIKIDSEYNDEDNESTQAPMTTMQEETTTSEITTTTIKPKMSRMRPTANRMGLRRQAFNNRLKRKRQKQKTSTTEPSAGREEFGVDLFGMPNLVSSSEFIARTQTPKPTKSVEDDDDFTTLDDFITTERSSHEEGGPRITRNTTISEEQAKNMPSVRFTSTTEETAKFEIEEILNDTRTSARLSRILMERNMTLNELVEHRERGSSHVHLADIFHNASKEPNPPEPFLSKSLIEPISKETYPLRAIIEANLHDPKAPTIDINPSQNYINIPLVLDFGNNVNENGENMGIMSLFNKYADNDDISSVENTEVGKDSEGTPYVTTVIAVNNTVNETARESRILKGQENNLKHDVLGWSELLELMRKSQENDTDHELLPVEDSQEDTKVFIPDVDGDGLIVLEDLEHLRVIDRNIGSPPQNINSYEREEVPLQPGILDRAPSHSRSVTVATASIVGLAMVLFLLTYAGFKWKQQRNMLRKKQSFSDERIPTPVFENRKTHKNNCSTRSISPMLATSNIYTMNTLDSSNGKESPDYMWDSLRKPFQ